MWRIVQEYGLDTFWTPFEIPLAAISKRFDFQPGGFKFDNDKVTQVGYVHEMFTCLMFVYFVKVYPDCCIILDTATEQLLRGTSVEDVAFWAKLSKDQYLYAGQNICWNTFMPNEKCMNRCVINTSH